MRIPVHRWASRSLLASAALALALGAGPMAPGQPARAAVPVDEESVRSVAAQLRCVVCQSLSVADSPSETARQMREVVRERLASGQTPDEVLAYFVEKYGTWILLAPPRRGFTLLVWAAPLAALLVGLGVVALSIRRWSGARGRSRPAEPAPAIDAATRARIRREAG